MNKLFDDLMQLVAYSGQENTDNATTIDTFYYQDTDYMGRVYRVFNYRLASFSSFQKTNAKNCRGTTFDITHIDEPVLVSLPPPKFFNYEEGDGEKYHTKNQFIEKMDKMDGSLISTYQVIPEIGASSIRLKSKTSLTSSQAVQAMDIMSKSPELLNEVNRICLTKNLTLNFEYTSLENRIVVLYDKAELTLLSLRFHDDGSMLVGEQLKVFLLENNCYNLHDLVVRTVNVEKDNLTGKKQLELVDNVRKEHVNENGEGYVFHVQDINGGRYLVKVKNLEYIELHNLRGNSDLNNGFSGSFTNKNISKIILMEKSDDLKSLYSHNQAAIDKIIANEEYVIPKYNKMIHDIDSFYLENAWLERKEYANKVQADENLKPYMYLLMNKYLNRHKEDDYKEFALKYIDKFTLPEENDE